MKWVNDWPVIGNDPDGTGTGEPVLAHKKPDLGKVYPVTVPQTSDEFDSPTLGMQWQWACQLSPRMVFAFREARLAAAVCHPHAKWGEESTGCPKTSSSKNCQPRNSLSRRSSISIIWPRATLPGSAVLGGNYSFAAIKRTSMGSRLIRISNEPPTEDTQEGDVPWAGNSAFLQVRVNVGASCEFSYSTDGKRFSPIGKPFHAQPGGWAGARIGLFCLATANAKRTGYVNVDWFRLEK